MAIMTFQYARIVLSSWMMALFIGSFLPLYGVGREHYIHEGQVLHLPVSDDGILHPIHLSYMEMHFNPSTKVFETTLKVYLDDIEAMIKRTQNIEMKLSSPKEHPQSTELMMQYIKSTFSVEVNGKKLSETRFIGKEYDLEAVWLYFEIPLSNDGSVADMTSPTMLTIRNAILHDMYADQNNMVHCTIRGVKKSILLRKGRDVEQIRF